MKSEDLLRGRRIVVTRPLGQSSRFVEMLKTAGAEVLLAPVIRVDPPADPTALRAAAGAADSFHWIVFTSVNGVEQFQQAMRKARPDSPLREVSLCAIGPATAAAIQDRWGHVDLVAEVHTAEGVLAALAAADVIRGRRFLLPQAAGARDVIAHGLRERGGEVSQVETYRTVVEDASAVQLKSALKAATVDMITFTSASAVRSFVRLAGANIQKAIIASIGPVTSEAVREQGLTVTLEADPHSIDGLMAVIVRHYAGPE